MGPVTAFERHARWRPGWDVAVARGCGELPLYVRGPRGDTYVSPVDMVQEAEIHRVFQAQGIPVPHVYGMIKDPLCIVMERLPGRIDSSTVADPDLRRRLRHEFIDIVARAHAIPVEAFAGTNIPVPATPREIALNIYAPSAAIFADRIAGRPWPLMEFAWDWIQRHAPTDCERPSFVNYDGGQFLFDEAGRVTGLIDFEVSSFGDPVAELSGMRLRDTSEPLGDLTDLVAHYEEVTGSSVSNRSIEFHTAAFCGVNGFLMWPLMFDSSPEQDYAVYLNYCVATSRWMIRAMAAHAGIALCDPAEPEAEQLGFGEAGRHLVRHLSLMPGGTAAENYARDSAIAQAQFLTRQARYGLSVLKASLEDIEGLLGTRPGGWEEGQAKLSGFVADAGGSADGELIQLFWNWLQRQAFILRDCGPASRLTPMDLQSIGERPGAPQKTGENNQKVKP